MTESRPDPRPDRAQWRANRLAIEVRRHLRINPRRRHWTPWGPAFNAAVILASWLAKPIGLYRRGRRNFLAIGLSEVELVLPELPAAFDGYRILQISDPHFDLDDGIAPGIAAAVASRPVDLCVLNGDYRARSHGGSDHLVKDIVLVLAQVDAVDGTVAVLGNHDGADMVEVLESLGTRVLVNEAFVLERDGAALLVTGLDDVHRFFTAEALVALGAGRAMAPGAFPIAVVHSPELVAEAEQEGYRLYLSGHTHGGQICLPGGRVIISRLELGLQHFAAGHWRMGNMQGYTSRGAGGSIVPLRFNCKPEVTVLTLRRGDRDECRDHSECSGPGKS